MSAPFEFVIGLFYDFLMIFRTYDDYDFVVIGCALLSLGLCFRLFWLLTTPRNKEK